MAPRETRFDRSRAPILLAFAILGSSSALAQEDKRTGGGDPPRIASADAQPRKPGRLTDAATSPRSESLALIAEARSAIAACKAEFAKVNDYTCTFFKRERVDGKLLSQNIMHMKARTKPTSFYFKFVQPEKGREAIYVAGKHSGKAVVHDVGIGKLLAGTLKLDPTGSMAMEDCRHPITEAGIGNMIDVIDAAWTKELNPEDSRVIIHPNAKVGDRACTLIESIHDEKKSSFMYHKVKIYIDTELNLPIRFESYDWPKKGHEPELLEEYIYSKLKLNVNLKDKDFDPANSGYSFGRF